MRKLIVLLIVIMFLSGCTGRWYWRSPITNELPIVLHLITPDHIFFIPAGTEIGDVVTKQDGWYLSEYYLQKVVEVSVE